MNKSGPIVVIEDDSDDQEILNEIFKELEFRNSVVYFLESEKALDFLVATDIEPFIIHERIEYVRGDLTSLEFCRKMARGCDCAIMAAANTGGAGWRS